MKMLKDFKNNKERREALFQDHLRFLREELKMVVDEKEEKRLRQIHWERYRAGNIFKDEN